MPLYRQVEVLLVEQVPGRKTLVIEEKKATHSTMSRGGLLVGGLKMIQGKLALPPPDLLFHHRRT